MVCAVCVLREQANTLPPSAVLSFFDLLYFCPTSSFAMALVRMSLQTAGLMAQSTQTADTQAEDVAKTVACPPGQ